MTRFVWVWLHLLQFCVSNQTTNPHEDSANKPWRPIPSGLISVHAARVLRWILLPICLAISVWCQVLSIGIALCLATLAHNELGWDAHWLPRNVLNAVGYASFRIAAARAGRRGTCSCAHVYRKELNCPSADAICAYPAKSALTQTLLSLVILTTIQAQDFKDVHGDSLIGRRTLPLMYPRGSRVLMAILLPTWSVLFTYCYADAGRLLPTCTVLLGAATGARFFFQRSEAQDKKTYLYYNVRTMCASRQLEYRSHNF